MRGTKDKKLGGKQKKKLIENHFSKAPSWVGGVGVGG